MNHGLDCKLTLVSTPAGFGKTTLVACWLGVCNRPSAWLSLDKNDNDLCLFQSSLSSRSAQSFRKRARRLGGILQAPQVPPSDYLAASLINEIVELLESFIFAFGDCHVLHDDDVQQLVARLVEAQPAQLHRVIASRSDPLLPLPDPGG